MQIILTHEQADFDAIASLLGAYLISQDSIPLLPRRINRNVRAFLTLYGVELPFLEQREFQSEWVEKVTIVDTQSMVSIKGVDNRTKVHIVDHHPIKESFPQEWSFTMAATGANTTIFIDTLKEMEIILNSIQATLLLLGIYEDTGSLTYMRTTPRDLRAASYLLEQGANLSIANNFLNHPLSEAQLAIFEELRQRINYYNILGHKIVISCANAREMDEELSTVAHKIRDQYDPDALFVLILTKAGIQLIARSTSDDIDVSEIAAYFGGGGHDRAAAGLIKDKSFQEIQDKLIEILPKFIRPAITVAQIMSINPQLLAPETSVEEAAVKMQRYGHEGYPVVKNNKIIGLLTRRAVDRAQSHKLEITAASLMEAGNYTVQPNDSIEHLQKLMIESSWGQIPVVDPDNQRVVGIVTRTDLIKTLKSQTIRINHFNFGDRLEKFLPKEKLALLNIIAEIAYENSIALYIVGGFVRDLIIDKPSQDFDLVVEGDAIYLAETLAKRFGGRITSHARFGTAKWLIKNIKKELINRFQQYDKLQNLNYEFSTEKLPDSVDLVSARTEFYTHPTALPTVEKGSIKLDLHRRDFTINTMALRVDGRHYGELHDYWGGLTDLRQGVVRVLHSLSFVDDPTRILRAIRFEKRFNFIIENRTLELMKEAIPLLSRVSGDRIRHELDNILLESEVIQMMDHLEELALFKAIHLDLLWDTWLREKVRFLNLDEASPDWGFREENFSELKRSSLYILLLLRQTEVTTRQIIARLKLSVQLAKAILAGKELWNKNIQLKEYKPSQITNWLDNIPAIAIYSVYVATESWIERNILDQYISKWQKIKISIDGHDLRKMGIPPGPHYRVILDALRAARIDEKLKNSSDERTMLNELKKKLYS